MLPSAAMGLLLGRGLLIARLHGREDNHLNVDQSIK
jgi:hypothetical protein